MMGRFVRRFASGEVMHQYGRLLETFETNSDILNDASFTIMHHISGDLKKPEALFVPQILKAFSSLWEDFTKGSQFSKDEKVRINRVTVVKSIFRMVYAFRRK